MSKPTYTTLLKLERVQRTYTVARMFAISLGADEKQFLATDAAMDEMRKKIMKELSGGIIRPNVSQGPIPEGEFLIKK